MSIKEKLEQAQTSQVVFEITADELTEFVKQLSAEQTGQNIVPVARKVNTPIQKETPFSSKTEKELLEKIEKLSARVDVLENVITEGKQILTTEEAAKFLGLSKSFVYKMTHEGTIPFYKPNGKVCYFEKNELLEWMRSCRVASEKEIEEMAKLKMRELALKSLKK